ncbi:MAG: hypothetical protein H7257_09205 [Taibaiella sp.]|nr:hypothetical protein [Taibaiella sp.]
MRTGLLKYKFEIADFIIGGNGQVARFLMQNGIQATDGGAQTNVNHYKNN